MRRGVFKRLGRKKTALLGVSALVVIAGAGGVIQATLGGAPSNQASGDIELQRGLVGYWKMNGNAKDATPYAKDGTVSGASLTADREAKSNSAYSLTTTNYIQLPSNTLDLATATTEITLTAWIKTSDTNGAIFGGRDSVAGNPIVNLLLGFDGVDNSGTGIPVFEVRADNGTGLTHLHGTTNLADNNWHFIVATRNSSKSDKLYVDGTQVNSTTDAMTSGVTMSNPRIGVEPLNGTIGNLNGSFDDMRVYNRAINAAEVSALYKSYDASLAAGSGQNSLVGQWKLDGNAKDATPNGNNGTLFSAPTAAVDRENKSNGAYSFNGSSQYISTADQNYYSPSVNGSMTISVWAMVPVGASAQGSGSCGNAGRNIVAKGASTQWEWAFENDNNNLLCFVIWSLAGSGLIAINVSRTMNDGLWHLYTAVITPSATTLYVDGTSAGSGGSDSGVGNGTQPLEIGRRGDGNYFIGSVDDVRVYKRALGVGEIVAMAQSYESQVSLSDFQKGLVGDWAMNGNAKDNTPYSNNGTVSGASLTTDVKGRANSAYAFVAASSQRIDLGTSVPSITGGDFSISVWARVTSGLATPTVFSQNIPASWSTNLFILYYGDTGASSGGIRVWWTGSSIITNTTSVVDSTWHHVVLTRSGSSFTLYKDGSQISTGTGATNWTSTNSYIGAANNNSTLTQFFNGSLDDLRIWKRALGTTEVAALYKIYR